MLLGSNYEPHNAWEVSLVNQTIQQVSQGPQDRSGFPTLHCQSNSLDHVMVGIGSPSSLNVPPPGRTPVLLGLKEHYTSWQPQVQRDRRNLDDYTSRIF